jgi:hypothetical protein
VTDFNALRVTVGRRAITVVELDLDFCQNAYGVAPCTAAVGTTGSQKCFNTFKTCQDQANYDRGSKTYRFCSNNAFLPIGENIFPCITSVDIAPTVLDPKGFSVSASATVTMQDFPHHDRGVDPYVADRAYEPFDQGTFFGKLRARNPYLINRVMRVKTGYVADNRTIYTTSRTYFIDHMEGPDANGRVRIIGKDILRFADAEKAQSPVQSDGTLSGDINNSVTSLTLTPSGVGANYPASGIVRVGDELISYSSKTSDTLNGLTRGAHGTAASAHDADDKVQLCIRYDAASIPVILHDLLTTYAKIDGSYIPLSEWVTEASTWLGSLTSTVILSEPEGVKSLINEILESTGCALWWDEEAAQLRFKVIVPFKADNQVPALNEQQHVIAGSLKVKDLESERVSRVAVYYGMTSPIASIEKESMKNVAVTVSADTESANAYNLPITREIVSRWISELIPAQELGDRLIKRYAETPRQVTLRLDAKDATITTGDLADLSSRLILDPSGNNNPLRYIVLQKREVEVGHSYEYTMLQVSTTASARVYNWAAPTVADWSAATNEEKAAYLYWSDDDGLMPDLTPGPTWS